VTSRSSGRRWRLIFVFVFLSVIAQVQGIFLFLFLVSLYMLSFLLPFIFFFLLFPFSCLSWTSLFVVFYLHIRSIDDEDDRRRQCTIYSRSATPHLLAFLLSYIHPSIHSFVLTHSHDHCNLSSSLFTSILHWWYLAYPLEVVFSSCFFSFSFAAFLLLLCNVRRCIIELFIHLFVDFFWEVRRWCPCKGELCAEYVMSLCTALRMVAHPTHVPDVKFFISKLSYPAVFAAAHR
jgi:predicted secreted protein